MFKRAIAALALCGAACAADYGPYYLTIDGQCDVWTLYVSAQTGAYYGKAMGCPEYGSGWPLVGWSDSTNAFLSAAGPITEAQLMDIHLDSNVMDGWISGGDGIEPMSLTYKLSTLPPPPTAHTGRALMAHMKDTLPK